ncbi:MAG TPA: GNAT family N-acetyltransferase [Pseudonocardiaceae bacterium]|nr:GNAT family N-acetyltransferase [Pseudonocardiaceae bacterium]
MTDPWPARLTVRPLTPDDARRIGTWRYDGPWSVYDSRPEAEPVTAELGYWAVTGASGGPLVGYYCTGAEARVPGLNAEPGVLDIGVGMAPHWVGQGHGPQFGKAVLDHVRHHHGPTALRAAVQSWNTRSRKLTQQLGFHEQGRHTCTQNGQQIEYTILTTDEPPDRTTSRRRL